MLAYQKNINIKSEILKVEACFIESPLLHIYFQLKCWNYYSVQKDVKLIYATKQEWHYMKLLLNMCFKFLKLPSILNIMVIKYLNLKTGILKIETNFIDSPVFDIKCPHFEFSYYSVHNNTIIYKKGMAVTEWPNTYSFWFFTLIMWISSVFFVLTGSLTCASEFPHITWRLFVSLSCSGKSLVFTLSWLTCSEDSELSATSTYNYTTLPGHYLIKTNNFSSKPCSFNLKNNTKIQLFFILTIFFYLQFFINNFHNNDQLHLLLQHFGCKILSLCWLAMMICTFYWKSSLWSQFLLLNIFKILTKNFCFEFLVLHWILNIIVYPNFNKLASSKLKTPLL